jgi:hypothetical protein
LRHMALNVMQKDTSKGSLRGKRKRASWDKKLPEGAARAVLPFEVRLPWDAALIDDLLDGGALAVQRVHGDDGVFQEQHLQQLQHRGDFVGLLVRRDLPQHHPVFAAPGADHVQCRFAAGTIVRATENLTVDRDNTVTLLGKRHHESLKCGTEFLGIK